MAGWLADLDPARHRTVAYVSGDARGDAAIIVLACDRVVISPNAVLGGSGHQAMNAEMVQSLIPGIREVAEKKFRSPSLAAAMIDPALRVFHYSRVQNGFTETRYLDEEELQELPEDEGWIKHGEITQAGKPLRITGKQALEEYQLAWETAGNFGEFKRLFDLETDPELLEPAMVDELLE
ncbi:MAG: hypothetical protein N2C14_23355, partial [Planctomycetales bacterium]